MAIWTEEVSNEGHVYAALHDDHGSFNFWLALRMNYGRCFPMLPRNWRWRKGNEQMALSAAVA